MQKILIFSLFMIFCGQAVAQINNPEENCRYDYEMVKQSDGTYSYIKSNRFLFTLKNANDYPWGICFNFPSFIEGAVKDMTLSHEVTSHKEDEWTKVAMQKWNTKYNEYKKNRWGSTDVNGIPDSPLFVHSCDRNKYNIIYTVKGDIPTKELGRYTTIHDFWDFRYFYAIITMDSHWPVGSHRYWTRAHFINVMMHELGHALGLPHSKRAYTEVMPSHGGGGQCEKKRELKLCTLKPYDFERFLWPYDPPSLAEQREYKIHQAHLEYEAEVRKITETHEYKCRQPQTKPWIQFCP